MQGKTKYRSILALVTFGVLAFPCLRYCQHVAPWNRIASLCAHLFMIFTSIAVILFYRICRTQLKLSRWLRWKGAPYISAVLLFVLILRLGTFQFGGSDESVTVHLATFYAQGLRPMIDFPSSVPPLFMAGVRLALLTLGLRWLSFAVLAAISGAVSVLWIIALLRRVDVSAEWALVLALTIEATTLFAVPIWWYNNITSLAIVLLLISVLATLQTPRGILPWISLSLALAMVITAKPNAIPAVSMVPLLWLRADKLQRIRAVLSVAGGIVIAALICWFAQAPLGLLIPSYQEVARLRGNPFSAIPWRYMDIVERIGELAFVSFLVGCYLYLFMRSALQKPRPWIEFLVCGVSILSSLVLVLTNSDLEITNLIPLITACIIPSLRPWAQTGLSSPARQTLVNLVLIVGVIAAYLGFSHFRIRAIGEGMFYEQLPTRMIRSGFLKGLEAGPRLQRVLAETDQTLKLYPSKVVFFGPRMEFEYAVFNRQVMRGMPLFWDSEGMFSPARFPQMITDIRVQDPDLLIFLKDDYTRMGSVAEYIKSSPIYRKVDEFPDLTIYVRQRHLLADR
jgi:hypothetical protein